MFRFAKVMVMTLMLAGALSSAAHAESTKTAPNPGADQAISRRVLIYHGILKKEKEMVPCLGMMTVWKLTISNPKTETKVLVLNLSADLETLKLAETLQNKKVTVWGRPVGKDLFMVSELYEQSKGRSLLGPYLPPFWGEMPQAR